VINFVVAGEAFSLNHDVAIKSRSLLEDIARLLESNPCGSSELSLKHPPAVLSPTLQTYEEGSYNDGSKVVLLEITGIN
jgi:hypothetical protein